MREILRDHGEAHLALVVRFITDSGDDKGALWSEIVGAMSDVLMQRQYWAERASDVDAALDTIDLNALRR